MEKIKFKGFVREGQSCDYMGRGGWTQVYCMSCRTPIADTAEARETHQCPVLVDCHCCSRRQIPISEMATETCCKKCEDDDNMERHMQLRLNEE